MALINTEGTYNYIKNAEYKKVSILLPQVYKIKWLAMQYAFTDLCERTCCSKEFTEFERETVKRHHCCNKSVCDLDIPPG